MEPGSKTLLVVDDDDRSRESVANALSRTGYRVISVQSGVEGLTHLEREEIDLAIVDLRMPGMDGIAVLEAIKRQRPNVQVMILTGYGSIESTVDAMQKGACGYLTKPVNLIELRQQVKEALSRQRLALGGESEEEQGPGVFGFHGLLGSSGPMQSAYETIRNVAPTNSTVLIRGESGTGKELVARAIHQLSSRSHEPFVPINCAAIPEALLESELFGHERGAFTGADRRRAGVFEMANGGTLFLDEVGDIPVSMQVKLLRVIEQRAFTRLGGVASTRTDIRVLSATHIDLERAIEKGRFREDFYYRINVVTIQVPPLRERGADIPMLVQAFARQLAADAGRSIENITQDAVDALSRHDWPGNVRELRNCVESVIAKTQGRVISADMLPDSIRPTDPDHTVRIPVGTSMQEAEMRMIRSTLAHTGGNQTRAAKVLQIGLRTLQRKIKQYGL